MKKSHLQIIDILRATVCGAKKASLADADWEKLWLLARCNHLEVIVYMAALENRVVVPTDFFKQMERKYYEITTRDARQIRCLKMIETALSNEKIPYALQKGSVLRYDYPQTNMRFMSDMDIYINPKDRSGIKNCMEQIGGVFKGTESGDDQFLLPGKLGVEFHGRLLYRKHEKGRIENYPAWKHVDETKNRLTEEGYAMNLIGHAVYDLTKGGPGVRYILDLWVYRHRHNPQPDWDKVYDVLKKDGIYDAAKNLLDLSEYLFGNGEETPLMKEMAEYVMAGGLYGDAARVASSELAITGGKRKALAHQVFRNRSAYENSYPWLKKAPFRLPIAWEMRLAKSLRKHRGAIKSWKRRINRVSEKEIKVQRERLKRFGV